MFLKNKNIFLTIRLKTEKNKNMLRTFWGSKWVKNKNVEAQKKIRRSYKKNQCIQKLKSRTYLSNYAI